MPKFFPRQQYKDALLLLGILVITFVCFLPVLQNDFTNSDDQHFILENPSVLSLDWKHILDNFRSTYVRVYVPLTVLTWALEYHFFGFNPFIFHLDNLFLHLGVVALVYWLARCLGLKRLPAGLATLIFSIHPLHVESVAWATERKDVLFGFFYAAALITYWKYIHSSSWRHYGAAVFLGLLSILSKPTALSLPLIFFLYDWYAKRNWHPRLLIEKIPHFLYIIPIALMTFLSHGKTGHNIILPDRPLLQDFLFWVWSFSFYIKKFLFPIHLVAYPQHPEPISLFHGPYIVSIFIFMASVISLIIGRKNRLLIFAFAFYSLSMFFFWRYGSLIKYTEPVAGRHMYLPCLGFCLLIGQTASAWIDSLRHKIPKIIYSIGVICIICLLGIKTYSLTHLWRDSITFWTYVIENNKRCAYRGYIGRANAYLENKKYALAFQDANSSLDIKSDTLAAYNIRGMVLATQNNLDAAIKEYTKGIRLNPEGRNLYVTYLNRADAYIRQEYYHLALKDIDAALTSKPDYTRAFSRRGKAYLYLGDLNKALKDFNQAIFLNPSEPIHYYDRGTLYMQQGRYGLALRDFNRAISMKPDDYITIDQRGVVHYLKGNDQAALHDFNAALDINPQFAKSYNNRATVLMHRANYKAALSDINETIKLDPNYAIAYANRSKIYYALGQYNQAWEDSRQAQKLGYPMDKKFIQQIRDQLP